MASLEIKNRENRKVDTLTINDAVFGLPVKAHLIHESVVNYRANQRQGTHSTKTRGMVSGGGKKPYKQKHTGRARAGSSRSPLWRGGAIVFGPQPRDYSYRMNKKQRRLALRTALSAKVAEQQFVVVDALSFEKPKTREMISLLASLGLADRKVLVITKDKEENVLLSSRNIPGVSIQTASDVNVYEVMNHDVLLATKDAVLSLQEVLQ